MNGPSPRRLALLAGAFLFAGLAAAALASVIMSLRFAADVASLSGLGAGMAALGRSSRALFPFHAFVFRVAGFPVAAACAALAEWRRERRPLAFVLGGALVPLNPLTAPASALLGKNDIAAISALLALYAAVGGLGGLVYWGLAGRNSGQWRRVLP